VGGAAVDGSVLARLTVGAASAGSLEPVGIISMAFSQNLLPDAVGLLQLGTLLDRVFSTGKSLDFGKLARLPSERRTK